MLKKILDFICNFLQKRTIGQKFLFLWLVCFALIMNDKLLFLSIFLALAIILYPLMGLSIKIAFKNLRYVFWMSVFLFAFQLITVSFHTALAGSLRIYGLFLFSYLLTLTTSTSEMMDFFAKTITIE